MCVYVYIYMHAYTYTHILSLSIYIINEYTYTEAYVHHVSLCVNTCAIRYISVYIYNHLQFYMCMCIYI